MTVDTSDPAVPTVDPERSRARRRARRVVGGTAAMILVAAVCWVGWTWRHPDTLGHTSLTEGMTNHVGQDVTWFGVTFPEDREPLTIHVDHATAHVSNGGDAEVDFFVCTRAPESGNDAIGIVGDLHRWCSSLVAAEDVDMRYGAGSRDVLVMRMRDTTPGVTRIDDIAVTYSAGWQHGTQHFPSTRIFDEVVDSAAR